MSPDLEPTVPEALADMVDEIAYQVRLAVALGCTRAAATRAILEALPDLMNDRPLDGKEVVVEEPTGNGTVRLFYFMHEGDAHLNFGTYVVDHMDGDHLDRLVMDLEDCKVAGLIKLQARRSTCTQR